MRYHNATMLRAAIAGSTLLVALSVSIGWGKSADQTAAVRMLRPAGSTRLKLQDSAASATRQAASAQPVPTSGTSAQSAGSKQSGGRTVSAINKGVNLRDGKMPDCDDIGLCPPGEKRVILNSKGSLALVRAMAGGCRFNKNLSDKTVLTCPESATIPDSRKERIFQVQDLLTAGQIGAISVHAQGLTGQNVLVAVLDTGVDVSHPELGGRILAAQSFVGDGGADSIGHGTHVSGIVLGQGVNEVTGSNGTNRVLGVAPGANILSAKVCTDEGWCPEGDIIAGIEWAVSQGARVINMSLGGGAAQTHCDGDLLAQKANWAVTQGVVVVAASGNHGGSVAGIASPACGSKVIAVGAVDGNDVRPEWSAYGTPLDVVAPGVDVLSSLPDSGYASWGGTSMASPHAAGAAAVLLQANPSLSPGGVKAILQSTAVDLGTPGVDNYYGHGRINLAAAVAAARDRDGDGHESPADCDDENPAVNPGVQEVCWNDIDDDCDGLYEEGCQISSSSSEAASSEAASSEQAASSEGSRSSETKSSKPPRSEPFRSSSGARSSKTKKEEIREEWRELLPPPRPIPHAPVEPRRGPNSGRF